MAKETQQADGGADSDLEIKYRAMNNFVANCPELREMERHLGRFNFFRVLGFEDAEIRHSNVLAWLFKPDESHGLRDLFLRRFLMRIVNDAESGADTLDPVAIDSARFDRVDVQREWQNIDIQIQITTDSGDWVVTIENKVNSQQHSDQLQRYRKIVESTVREDTRKLYILLTKHAEEPEDESYLPATYGQVFDVLKSCVEEQESTIGTEPLSLLRSYLSLLEERFMDNSTIADLAKRIIASHRIALDAIYEHRQDEIEDLSNQLAAKIQAANSSRGLILMPTSRSYVRFIPKEWSVARNLAGNAWGKDGAYVLCEIPLTTKQMFFKIIVGKAPDYWIDKVWKRSQSAPFQHNKKVTKRPNEWVTVYRKESDVRLDDLRSDNVESVAQKAWKWIEKQLDDSSFKKSAKVVEKLINDLPPSDGK